MPGTALRPAAAPLQADVVVAVGGDGTMLEAVRVALEADLPVLGVNAGHVGFLTRVEPGRLDAALDALAAGGWAESRRMTLCARVRGRPDAVGLNDVVVEKAVSQHVVKISVVVGEERLVSYRADGVVVATPTGSTAYTFSAGGPLVDPELEALVVTAVAPHNLFARPIVFRPEVVLRLTVDDDRPARVNVDGRTLAVLAPGEEVEVSRGERAGPLRRVVAAPLRRVGARAVPLARCLTSCWSRTWASSPGPGSSPGAGLVAVTGETGAGKTLLLGALRLLRGDAARSDRIGPAGPETRVEGRFVTGAEEIVVARRVEEGRSRAYLDGSMVPLRVLEERLRGIVEIVAQHEHVALGREAAVRPIVDGALDEAGRGAFWRPMEPPGSGGRGCSPTRRHWGATDGRWSASSISAGTRPARSPPPASPRARTGALAEQVERLRHAAGDHRGPFRGPRRPQRRRRRRRLARGGGRRAAAGGRVRPGPAGGRPAGRRPWPRRPPIWPPTCGGAAKRWTTTPRPSMRPQQRLAVLADLRRKYGETLDEVVAFGEAARQRAETLAGLLERADSLAHEAAAAEAAAAVPARGADLAAARAAAGERLAAAAEGHLRELGFRSPVLRVTVAPAAPGRSGSRPRGAALRLRRRTGARARGPGGQRGRAEPPGAGGAPGRRRGRGPRRGLRRDRCRASGEPPRWPWARSWPRWRSGRQVLVVTHLPQVAAFADTHLVVDREGSRATRAAGGGRGAARRS